MGLFDNPIFRLGIVDAAQLPTVDVPEFAFCGRSNVGKSSLINALTGRKSLARVSRSPGATKQLNFFSLGGDEPHEALAYLVDLPGYGHARVSKSTRSEWDNLIGTYLKGRRQLTLLLALIDSRHGVKDNDKAFFDFLENYAVPFVVVLTKMDAVKPGERAAAEASVKGAIKKYAAAFPEVFVTSAEEKVGIEELRGLVKGRLGV